MKRGKLLAVGLMLSLGLTLAACASSPSDGSAGSGDSDTSLSEVTKKGELSIATEGTYKPFSYHQNGSGKLTGYDVEVAEAVAAKLGVKATFQETQFDGIFAGLDAKRFDVIANQISINPDRQKKYDFSTPYTISAGVIVTKDSDDSIKSFDDLKGKTTAQSLTSNWYKLAQQSGATVQSVEGWAQAVELLKQDRVNAVVNDKLTYLDYAKNTPNSGLKIAAETSDKSQSAITARKGSNALISAIDKALAELTADGTLSKISTKYFGTDVSK